MKLDLHTHCAEAANFARPTDEVAAMILDVVEQRGLDGIAITDHDTHGADFAFAMRDAVSRLTGNRTLIIPGLEVSEDSHHIVELYLSDDQTFRFIPHPTPRLLRQLEQQCNGDIDRIHGRIHGIEIENGTYWIDPDAAREFALTHGLVMLSNSDAHLLPLIGLHYNDIDLADLVRAVTERADK